MSDNTSVASSGVSLRLAAGSSRRLAKLTSRQAQILRGMVWGRTADEIGEWLHISARTVEIHRSQLMHRLGARNAADATRIALISGFDFRPEPGKGEEGQGSSVDFILSDCLEPGADLGGAPRRGNAHLSSSPRALKQGAVARAIGFSDANYPERIDWLCRWLQVEDEYVYSPWDARMLSQAQSSFDLFVVHGSDARRIANAVRKFRRAYARKIMIAVMDSATPVLRASIYRAGADAVYTLNTDPEEAAAWLGRALSRQAQQDRFIDQNMRMGKAYPSGLVKLIGEEWLTPFECRALSLLEQAKGQTVSYAKLSSARNSGDPNASGKLIHVYFSRLKTKLNGFPRLENVRGQGYRLTEPALVEALDYWRQNGRKRPVVIEVDST